MIGTRPTERAHAPLAAPEPRRPSSRHPSSRRARCGATRDWQLRDFVRNRAVWLAPLALLGVWFLRESYDPSWLTLPPESGGPPPTRRGRVLPAADS
jgi:hypothetical protein